MSPHKIRIIAIVDGLSRLLCADADGEHRKWFAHLTRNSVVIMDEAAYHARGPIGDCAEIIVVADREIGPSALDARVCPTLAAALAIAGGDCFVMGGGAAIYRAAFRRAELDIAYIATSTSPGRMLRGELFPREELDCAWSCRDPSSDNHRRYYFCNCDEEEYLRLVDDVLAAPPHANRTGVATRSLFGRQLRFKLGTAARRVLPLLTHRRIGWRIVYHELIWFLRGSTNTQYLRENNVRVWDGNSTKEFIESRGLNYDEGVVGPIYGAQWRNWSNGDWAAGRDQLAGVVEALISDKWSRRHVVSAWNVGALDKMVLPPCHYAFQFVVDGTDVAPRLNCIVNMRSADLIVGVPYNIASYALLTHIVSSIVGLEPGELVVSMADCHIYESHVESAMELCADTRTPMRFPVIEIPAGDLSAHTNQFTIDDYHLRGYSPLTARTFEMVV